MFETALRPLCVHQTDRITGQCTRPGHKFGTMGATEAGGRRAPGSAVNILGPEQQISSHRPRSVFVYVLVVVRTLCPLIIFHGAKKLRFVLFTCKNVSGMIKRLSAPCLLKSIQSASAWNKPLFQLL